MQIYKQTFIIIIINTNIIINIFSYINITQGELRTKPAVGIGIMYVRACGVLISRIIPLNRNKNNYNLIITLNNKQRK